MKFRLTPFNLLTLFFGIILVFVLTVTKDTGGPRHVDFRGLALMLFAIPLTIDLILRLLFKDYIRIVIVETIFLIVLIISGLLYGYFG